MRRFVPLAVLVAVLAGATGSAAPPAEATRILEHIRFLSSDDFRGRANGSAELERAADYIAQQFEAAGLRPGGPDGSWFQPFTLIAGLSIDSGNSLELKAGDRSVSLTLGKSYLPLSVTPSTSATVPSVSLDALPLVFAGYGISASGVRYDDYAGLDVRNKAVLVFSHEPQENQRNSRLNGAQPLRETTLFAKAQAARMAGARALLVVTDPTHAVEATDFASFTVDPDPEDHGIPVLRISRPEIAPLLEAWGLDQIATDIDRDLMPRSRALAGASVSYSEHLSFNRRTVRNVIGVLNGADAARAQQAIVIGAHYDHVGMGGRLSTAPERSEIHNGADDNASGTAALIEIARNAVLERTRFPRTLVFVAFAGEERGLLGSAHYSIMPTVPMADTVAMINLDMVGRANGKVEVGGLEGAPSLSQDVNAAARVAGLDARRGGPGAGRSDDASFLQRGVPSLHFFTGFHDDYHRPSDDWNLIDAPGTAKVATLALELAARIAARQDRPQMVP